MRSLSFKNELDFTHWFCGELLKCNCFIQAVVGSGLQQNGWPDRYIVHRFWRGHVEFKWEKGRTRPAQIDVMKELLRRECPAIIIRGWACGIVSLENVFDEYATTYSLSDIERLRSDQVGGYLLNWIIEYCSKLNYERFQHARGMTGNIATQRRRELEGT